MTSGRLTTLLRVVRQQEMNGLKERKKWVGKKVTVETVDLEGVGGR